MKYISIFEAAQSGTVEDVKYLIEEKGIYINSKSNSSGTPLSYACMWGNDKVVPYLLSKGADVNVIDFQGLTPLILACGWNMDKIIPDLISRGANVNACAKDGDTALHRLMSGTPSLETVKLLVTKGANVNAKGKNNVTPLHLAAEWASAEILEYLITQGADANAKTFGFLGLFGKTPLQLVDKDDDNYDVKRRILLEAMKK